MHSGRSALLVLISAAAVSFVITGGKAEAKSLSSSLPSAGVSYTLSGNGVTLRDVEEELKAVTATASTAVYISESVYTDEAGSASSDIQSSDQAVTADETAASEAGTTTVTQESQTASSETSDTSSADAASGETVKENAGTAVSNILTTNLSENQQKAIDEIRKLVDNAENSLSNTSATDSTSASDAGTSTEKSGTSETTVEGIADDKLAVSTADDFVNIRKEPSTDSEVLGKLYSNAVAQILEETDDGWCKIQSGDVTGYVKKEFVTTGEKAKEIAEETSTLVATVTTETLRVRAAADMESDVITLVPQGEKLDIISETDGWIEVNTSDGQGFISADFADVENEYVEAESKEAEEARITSESTSSGSASGSSLGQKVANYALQFVGNPYVWGGTSLTNGADCSGFVLSVFAHFGYKMPHNDAADRSMGTAVDGIANAQPGDVVCYYGHVGIYIGGGQIVNASNPTNGIRVNSASYRQIVAIRRIAE